MTFIWRLLCCFDLIIECLSKSGPYLHDGLYLEMSLAQVRLMKLSLILSLKLAQFTTFN